MEELSELELTLLNGLITKYPQLSSHIPYLKVNKRELTGNGMVVDFLYVDFNEEFGEINALFSNGENIQVKGLKDGLSYVVDITVGEITSIEFTTYGEKWDGKFTEYKIVEKE